MSNKGSFTTDALENPTRQSCDIWRMKATGNETTGEELKRVLQKKRHSRLCQDRCGVEEEAFLTPVILTKYRSKSKNGSVVRSVLGPYLEKRYGRKTSTFLFLVPYYN